MAQGMDVRCERCKTLYELDEARVSEAGTTVRCTTCGHVFRVRKKVLLMTEAVGAGRRVQRRSAAHRGQAALAGAEPERPGHRLP